MQEFQLYIGGRSMPAASGATYESINPYTGRPWAVVPDAGLRSGKGSGHGNDGRIIG